MAKHQYQRPNETDPAKNETNLAKPETGAPDKPAAPLGLQAGAPDSAETTHGRQNAAGSERPRPECPYCKIPCGAGSTHGYFTYYYCSNEGCTYSIKVPRPQMKKQLEQDAGDDARGFSAR
jgi:hypothetical protein